MYRCSYTYLWRRTKQHIFIKQERLNGRVCTDCCGQRTNGLSPDQPPTKLIFDSCCVPGIFLHATAPERCYIYYIFTADCLTVQGIVYSI